MILETDEVRISLREYVGDFTLQLWTNVPAGTSPAEVELTLSDSLIIPTYKDVYVQIERTSAPDSGTVLLNSETFRLYKN